MDPAAVTPPNSSQDMSRPAGFRVRCTAAGVDAVLVIAVVVAAASRMNSWGWYVPIELSCIVIVVVYAVVMSTWQEATIGKRLCGLRVCQTDGRPVGLRRSLFRETIGKLASTIALFLGFLWIGLRKHKRGWHDLLSGTSVTCTASRPRIRLVGTLVGAGAVSCLIWYLEAPAASYLATRAMAVPPNTKLPSEMRSPSALIEVATLREPDEQRVADWLAQYGSDPLDYVVAKSKIHQVILLGEMHEQGDTLRWFNEAIPVLHERAGVTCIAMEVCLAEDNPQIERLVTGAVFDRELAAEIARHQPWGLWGWKEYWDVLQTVWQVNQSIPAGSRKMRLIGLDKPMDVPSLVMMGLSEMPLKRLPPWEKLRAWRLPRVVGLMMMRDGAMAQEIDREIIMKDERAVVLVGAMHSTTGCRQPGRDRWGCMGMMLHQRYPDRIFQIRLHQMDIPASLVHRNDKAPPPMMAAFLEKVMARNGRKPVGFDVAPSPLALVRDEATLEYHAHPTVGFCDLAMGYIYLKDRRKITHCRWQQGYVSEQMFTRNKPMYQALARLLDLKASRSEEMDRVGPQMGP